MIAPTKMYDAFPAITPGGGAADMICEALRKRPKHMGTRLGTVGEVLYTLSPKAVDRILHLAYRVFPDSASLPRPGATSRGARLRSKQIAMTCTLTLAGCALVVRLESRAWQRPSISRSPSTSPTRTAGSLPGC